MLNCAALAWMDSEIFSLETLRTLPSTARLHLASVCHPGYHALREEDMPETIFMLLEYSTGRRVLPDQSARLQRAPKFAGLRKQEEPPASIAELDPKRLVSSKVVESPHLR